MVRDHKHEEIEKPQAQSDHSRLPESSCFLYVTGSGLIPIPEERLKEIPRAIQEHHLEELNRAKIIGHLRRSYW